MLPFVWAACKDHGLEDFALQKTSPSSVSAGAVAGAIRKDNEKVTIPLKVALNTPATRAFEVGLQFNADTVQGLIDDNTLENTAALPVTAVTLPNVVRIPFGADSAIFEVSVSITELERLYGMNVAMAFNLVQPGKGNSVGAPRSGLVVLNTTELLNVEDIHYVSITNGAGGILEARNRQNYVVTSAGLTIPLGITLAGIPGRLFSVRTFVNADTISHLVADDILPENTVALNPEQYNFDTLYNVGSNRSSADMNISIPWSVINNNQDKLLALYISIDSASRHVINEEKNHVIILIHPSLVVEVDVTNDGVFSVSRDNNGGPGAGEGSLKLIDNNLNSKFLQANFAGDLWIQLLFNEPQFIGAYTMTSADDAPERDPKDWNLQGSMDGENWVTLDTRTGEVFANRFLTKRYEFNATQAYTHYRLNITANAGNNLYQQAEWRLIRVP